MPALARSDAEVHYEVAGNGPPVLLIAGTANDISNWELLKPFLTDSFQLICFDNRGCGRTQSEGDIHVEDMVGDCVALIDYLSIAPARVLGHSLGGVLGRRLAAQFPDRVSKLVTIGAGGGMKVVTLLRDLADLYASGIPPHLFFRIFYQWVYSPSFFNEAGRFDEAVETAVNYAHRQTPADLARQVAMLKTVGPIDRSTLTAPVLAISSSADQIASPAEVAEAHADIANVEFATIARSGHSPQLEQPEQVAELVTDFLSRA